MMPYETLINPPAVASRAHHWPWLDVKAHLDTLLARLPRDYGAAFIEAAATFCDEAHRDDAAAFFKDRAPAYLEGPRSLARMIERADLCMATRRAVQPGIVELLKKQ